MNTGHQVIVKADAGDDCNLVGGGWSLGAADMTGYDHYVHTSGAELYWAVAGDAPMVT